MEKFVAWALTTLVSAFVGSYLASYLKKKGENLATHEDIDKLLEQVRAVTTTTKEIEAKISSDVWDQQKRWELKRDALFEGLKGIAGVEDSLSALHAVYKTDEESGSERPEERLKAYSAFNKAANDLDRSGLIIGLVCGEHLRNDLLEFGVFTRDIGAHVHEGRPFIFIAWGPEFVEKKKKILDAMRKEIEGRTSVG
jgi:hypothetical protein